ncbi:MAG: tRNA (adenosine(37)-N6)-threonylcarbamoyltransferase complex ATPase subunit type 1 TsaE [Rickettsiales bacterium]|jgi:tRNA threonylcarbamoyl adenosine modification protein YjeE|nr:tRNA (adenosine(37)-N6)-threonylcarbamoyltransferase complex ATPase subunit type 1 TsaE [Rickettsiales bacterium]
MKEKTYDFLTETEMQKFASRLARKFKAPTILALIGDLGTGKTTFARAFIKELVGQDTIVPSPTFTILQTYKKDDLVINHLDLYRLTEKEELIELDLQSLFDKGITMIEWPQLATSFFPKNTIILNFFIQDEIHKVLIQSQVESEIFNNL